MKSIRFRLLIATMAVLLGTAIAKSQTTSDATPAPPPAHQFHHGFGPGQMGFFSRKLNVTDEQRTQMKAIMQKEHPALKPLFQQEHQIDLQLRQYVEGTYDEAKVQALAAQKAQIHSQLVVAQTRIHSEMYKVLTSEQQAQLKEMEANREARMQQRMQNAPSAPPQE